MLFFVCGVKKLFFLEITERKARYSVPNIHEINGDSVGVSMNLEVEKAMFLNCKDWKALIK